MAGPTLRDRLLTHRATRAATSASGIVVAGAGVAAGILIGLPLAGVLALGAGAWAARVAVAVPRRRTGERVDAMALHEPWREFVWEAQQAQRRFTEATERARSGPLQDRLATIGGRVDDAVDECWRVARAGEALTEARSAIDAIEAHSDLMSLADKDGRLPPADSNLGRTAAALQAQLATAERLDATIADAHARLQLLDARLGEIVTRAIELAAQSDVGDQLGPLRGLGDDVEGVVVELEALRGALDETGAVDPTSTGSLGSPDWPSTRATMDADPAAADEATPGRRDDEPGTPLPGTA